jgi:hypothetical protein
MIGGTIIGTGATERIPGWQKQSKQNSDIEKH